jgi:hypothetical protein
MVTLEPFIMGILDSSVSILVLLQVSQKWLDLSGQIIGMLGRINTQIPTTLIFENADLVAIWTEIRYAISN